MISPAHKNLAGRVAGLVAGLARPRIVHTQIRLVDAEWLKLLARPWSALELAFYDAVRRLLGGEAQALAESVLAFGPAAVDFQTFWHLHDAALADEFSAALSQIARLGALEGRAVLGARSTIGINWGLTNQSAVDWASRHAVELARDIEPVTRQGVRQAVSEWTASGQPVSALADKIRELSAFSPARAQLIARTEATNAYARGNATAWEAAGVQPAATTPAAHPGCRCYLKPFRVPANAGTPDGTEVMVWYTAHDERVCTQPLEMPWGRVEGCADLHDVIVSRGQWLGQKKPT